MPCFVSRGRCEMIHPFEALPRRIFLDSCTAQTLRDYGGYIYEGEPILKSDRIHRVTDGLANVEALRDIFLISERALFDACRATWPTLNASSESASCRPSGIGTCWGRGRCFGVKSGGSPITFVRKRPHISRHVI
jgi:hypothetical protein